MNETGWRAAIFSIYSASSNDSWKEISHFHINSKSYICKRRIRVEVVKLSTLIHSSIYYYICCVNMKLFLSLLIVARLELKSDSILPHQDSTLYLALCCSFWSLNMTAGLYKLIQTLYLSLCCCFWNFWYTNTPVYVFLRMLIDTKRLKFITCTNKDEVTPAFT